MAARRLIVVMLVLLVVSSIAAALVPVESEDETSSSTRTPAASSSPPGELVQRTIRADARKPKTVGIEVGDQLVLRVTSPRLVQVQISGLGELVDADPDAPARFDLLPPTPGRFKVRTLDPAREIGRIVVAPRESKPGGDAGPDSKPGEDGPETKPGDEPAPADPPSTSDRTT